MKKTRSAVSLIVVSILFFAVTILAHASSQFDEGVVANQQLPSFIPDGAVSMTEAEMSEVRGEWFLSFALWIAENGVMLYELGTTYWAALQMVSQAPSGTPVYLDTAHSTPAYFKP